MKLVYRIPLITLIILVLTAIVNIGSFQYFSEVYFSTYVSELSKESTPDPDRLRALLQIGKLDKKDQAEYLAIFSELANISTSIENISKNPELYMGSGGSDTMFSIPTVSSYKWAGFSVFRLGALGDDSPEWRFVTSILKWVFFANFIWLSLVLVLYLLWIRSIFRPIGIVTENIRNIIDRKRYASIRYSGNNEFAPLISTINNLHKSLSIQEKIRSDFLSDLSHEIRTPITAVKCYLEGIQDGVMKLDTGTVDLLQSELERLTHITGRIMDYESLTHDIFEQVKVERFSLRRITEDIVSEYIPQLQKNSQKTDIRFPSDTMTSMDKNMYIQILHNIMSNFIKYAGSDTTLTFSYEKSEKEYVITFSDDGTGIPEDELMFVKEKFYRVDKARTGTDKSMGIWLSIVDRIARLHRGSLSLEKNTPRGVRVMVRVGR